MNTVKINFLFGFFFWSFYLIITSCGTARLNEMRLAAKEESPPMFVQNTEKEIIPVTDFKKFKFNSDSLTAKQDKYGYSRIVDNYEYMRTIKGRMNLYLKFSSYTSTYYTGNYGLDASGWHSSTKSRLDPYFDIGADQPLVLLNRQNLGPYLKDCSPCKAVLKDYDQTRKHLQTWKYINWASMGTGLALGLIGDPKELSDFQAYGFVTFLFGGVISEVYRLTRVSKNEKKLEHAIMVYNQMR